MTKQSAHSSSVKGFSLIEVVLAIGIFLVTVLALVGLLGPTLKSVDEVEKTDEVSSIVNTVNAFLQNSPGIATATESKFEAIFNAVANDGSATLFVFRAFADANPGTTDVELKVGFYNETVGDASAEIEDNEIVSGSTVLAAGPVFRVVLSPSSVTPASYLTGDRDSNSGIYALADPLVTNYLEGYFAMEVRIFAESAGVGYNPSALTITDLADFEPIFTYNTAVVR